MSPASKRLVLPFLAFLFGLVALGVAVVTTFTQTTQGSAVGGPFTLVDHDGKTVTQRDFQGAPHLVFFGFTHCPDVCPTKLFELSEVLRATGDKGKDLRALFITVDPERDTPELMKNYVGSFDPRIVGLSGDRPAIEAATKAYKAFARKVPTSNGDYTMEHTATIYLMGRKGEFLGTFDVTRPPAEAAADLLKRV
jgi:protein SCO1/2